MILVKRWWSVFGACGPSAFQHTNSEVSVFVNKICLVIWFWLSLALGFLCKSKLPVFRCDPRSLREMTRNLWQYSRVASLVWLLPGPANVAATVVSDAAASSLPATVRPCPAREQPQCRSDCVLSRARTLPTSSHTKLLGSALVSSKLSAEVLQ